MKKVIVGKSKGIKPISNRFYTLLATVKKALTYNRCDNCGLTKDEVYVTEYFTEAGFIECKTLL